MGIAAACGHDRRLSLRTCLCGSCTQYPILYFPIHMMLYNVIFSKQMNYHSKLVCRNVFVRRFHTVMFPRLGRQPQPWGLSSFSFLGNSIMRFWCQKEVHLVVLPVWKGWWEHLRYPFPDLEDSEWRSAKLLPAALLTSAELWSHWALLSFMVIK